MADNPKTAPVPVEPPIDPATPPDDMPHHHNPLWIPLDIVVGVVKTGAHVLGGVAHGVGSTLTHVGKDITGD
jgi:hypothetical protein